MLDNVNTCQEEKFALPPFIFLQNKVFGRDSQGVGRELEELVRRFQLGNSTIITTREYIDFVTASQFFTTNGSFYESEITIEMLKSLFIVQPDFALLTLNTTKVEENSYLFRVKEI